MSETWVTSDLHLDHKNIINYCSRPWAKDPRNPTREETAEMNEALIRNWNAVVGPNDIVYNLGDLAYCANKKRVLEALWALNGKHRFLRGNHDALADEIYLEHPSLFDQYLPDPRHSAPNVPGYLETIINGQAIIMQHYAIREWHHALKGVWHIYGHTHSYLPPFGKSCDVGVDNSHVIIADPDQKAAPANAFYRPIHWDELKAYMDRLPIGPHPEFEHYRPGHPEIKYLEEIEDGK